MKSYNALNVSDYIKNPKASLNKPVKIIKGIVIGFNQGSENYIEVIDSNDMSSRPKSINFRVEDDNNYTKITNDLSKWDNVLIYGFGENNILFNIVGDGGSYESYEPVISIDAVYKCKTYTNCTETYFFGNDEVFKKEF